MGNILTTRADNNCSTNEDDGDRFVREVGKLFALDGSPEVGFRDGEPSSSSHSSYHSRQASYRKPLDNDVLSKSTDSTKGSPDLSLQGRLRLGEQQRHRSPATSSSSSPSCTSLPMRRSGPHHGTPSASGVVENHGSSSSTSHLSKSPFSRFFRSRKSEEDKSNHSSSNHHPHNLNKKASSNLPSCVTIVERRNPPSHYHPAFRSSVLSPRGGNRTTTTTTATTTTTSSIPVKSNHGSQESFEDEEASANHLQQLYDLRTWDMYLRITEARKKQQEQQPQVNPSQIPHAQQPSAAGGGNDDTPHHHYHREDCSSGSYDEYGWFDDATSATTNGDGQQPNDFVIHQPAVMAPTTNNNFLGSIYPQPVATASSQYIQPLYAVSPAGPIMPQSPPVVATAATPTDTSQDLIFGDLEL